MEFKLLWPTDDCLISCFKLCAEKENISKDFWHFWHLTSPSLCFLFQPAFSRGLGQFPGHSGSYVQDALQVRTQPASCAHVRSISELSFVLAKFSLMLATYTLLLCCNQINSCPRHRVETVVCVWLTGVCCKRANFCSVFAVEHTSKKRETNRADVWALQHSCLLPLQISCAVCVSFTVSLRPGEILMLFS